MYALLLLPGDGIGPEVMAEVERVIAFFNAKAKRLSTSTSATVVTSAVAVKIVVPRTQRPRRSRRRSLEI